MLGELEYNHVGPRSDKAYPRLPGGQEAFLIPYIELLEECNNRDKDEDEDEDEAHAKAMRTANYLRCVLPLLPDKYCQQVLQMMKDVAKQMTAEKMGSIRAKLPKDHGTKTLFRASAVKTPGGSRVEIPDLTGVLSGLAIIGEALAEERRDRERRIWKGRLRQMFADMGEEGWTHR